MEPDVRKILLGHCQHVVGVGQIDVSAFLVGRHVLRFPFLEVFQRGRIVALDPTRFIKVDRLPAALGTILMQQAVLDHLKLQLPDRPFMGSAFSIYLNISGEKLGKPLKCNSSPAVSVSPILKLPVSGKPTMSPA